MTGLELCLRLDDFYLTPDFAHSILVDVYLALDFVYDAENFDFYLALDYVYVDIARFILDDIYILDYVYLVAADFYLALDFDDLLEQWQQRRHLEEESPWKNTEKMYHQDGSQTFHHTRSSCTKKESDYGIGYMMEQMRTWARY